MNRDQIHQILNQLGTQADKSLGQNFLVNEKVIQAIVLEAHRFSATSLIEIGPGLGALTNHWLPLWSLEKISLIELDSDFAGYWKAKNFLVYEADALRWSWNQVESAKNTVLVSNLPYQIAASLVIDRSQDPQPLAGMVLMFQKEVAQRIQVSFGDSNFGMLAVISQTFWKIKKVIDASQNDFYPPPKIRSRVLSFTPQQSQIENRQRFLHFVKLAFSHPRKKLISNLKSEFEMDRLQVLYADLKLAEAVRPHQLSPAQYQSLFLRTLSFSTSIG